MSKVLYHYTCQFHIPSIAEANFLTLTTSNFSLENHNLHRVRWLTDSPTPDNMDLTRIPNPTEKDKERIKKYRAAADRIMDALPYADAIPNCPLIEIDGVAEIHPAVSLDQFPDMFIRFIESHGWFFSGGYKDITDEENNGKQEANG